MVLFSLLLPACPHNSSWAVWDTAFSSHIHFYSSIWAHQGSSYLLCAPSFRIISTSIHSCGGSCAILECYYSSLIYSISCLGISVFWLYSPSPVNQGAFSARVTLLKVWAPSERAGWTYSFLFLPSVRCRDCTVKYQSKLSEWAHWLENLWMGHSVCSAVDPSCAALDGRWSIRKTGFKWDCLAAEVCS